VAVGTPSGVDGEADLKYIRTAVESMARYIDGYTIIVNRSTVPVGTGDSTAHTLIERGKRQGIDFQVVSNPEFTREGSAIYDFLNPDRVVLGSVDAKDYDYGFAYRRDDQIRIERVFSNEDFVH